MGWAPGDPDAAGHGDAFGNPQQTRLQEKLNQLRAPQGGAQMTTLQHPICYSGRAVPRTRADHFQTRGGPFPPFTKGTRRVAVPGATAGVQPSRVRAQRPPAPSQGPGATRGGRPDPRRGRLGRPRAAAPPRAAGKGERAGSCEV